MPRTRSRRWQIIGRMLNFDWCGLKIPIGSWSGPIDSRALIGYESATPGRPTCPWTWTPDLRSALYCLYLAYLPDHRHAGRTLSQSLGWHPPLPKDKMNSKYAFWHIWLQIKCAGIVQELIVLTYFQHIWFHDLNVHEMRQDCVHEFSRFLAKFLAHIPYNSWCPTNLVSFRM